MKLFSFWAKIDPRRHKLQKPSKLKRNVKKNPVFLESFKYSSIWQQSYRTKPQLAYLVVPGASFVTPGTTGGTSIVKIQEF